MKIKIGTLRRLISESTPKDPQLAALPDEVRLQHNTEDGSSRVWTANRDVVNIAMLQAGVPKEYRMAILMGQKAMNDKLVQILKKTGAIQPVGAPARAASPAPAAGPSASGGAPAAAGAGRMAPERAREWLDYYIRRFVRVVLKSESPPRDASEATEIADNFLTVVPEASKLVARMGLSPNDLTSIIVDKMMNGIADRDTRAAAVADRAAMAPKMSKDTYKIYPGGKRYGSPVVTRVKGRVFKGPTDSQFKPGEVANVAADGEKLRVKKTDSDHAQMWDPE